MDLGERIINRSSDCGGLSGIRDRWFKIHIYQLTL